MDNPRPDLGHPSMHQPINGHQFAAYSPRTLAKIMMVLGILGIFGAACVGAGPSPLSNPTSTPQNIPTSQATYNATLTPPATATWTPALTQIASPHYMTLQDMANLRTACLGQGAVPYIVQINQGTTLSDIVGVMHPCFGDVNSRIAVAFNEIGWQNNNWPSLNPNNISAGIQFYLLVEPNAGGAGNYSILGQVDQKTFEQSLKYYPPGMEATATPAAPPTLSGLIGTFTLFHDYNANAIRDPNEPTIPGLRLAVNNTECVTDAQGICNISGIKKGMNSIRIPDTSIYKVMFPSTNSVVFLNEGYKFPFGDSSDRNISIGLSHGFLTPDVDVANTNPKIYAWFDTNPAIHEVSTWLGMSESNVIYYSYQATTYDGHDGFDLVFTHPTSVLAPVPGRISLIKLRDDGFGYSVDIEIGTYTVLIGHVIPKKGLSVGMTVKRGEILGQTARYPLLGRDYPLGGPLTEYGYMNHLTVAVGNGRYDPIDFFADPNFPQYLLSLIK